MRGDMRAKGQPLLMTAFVIAVVAAPAFADSPPAEAQPQVVEQPLAPAISETRTENSEEPVETTETGNDTTLIGEGMASYYGNELAGSRTASGEKFNPRALTAAHRTLPMGSKVRVTNLRNGRSVVVRINDRGPFTKHRILDVSRGAAEELEMVRSGTAKVRMELVEERL